MARPRKEGMDYFPHDVHMSTDKKVKALRIVYGNDGYTFFNIALEMIYQEPNFELDVSDAETIQILASNVEVTVQKLSEMIATAVKHGCFDKERYNNDGVLTSNGILKRAEVVINKRVAMRDKYDKKVSDAETQPEMPQSKVKGKERESKEKVNKVIKKEYADYVFLTETEYDKLTELFGIDERDNFFLRYASWVSGQTERVQKSRSAYLTILNWHRDSDKRLQRSFTPKPTWENKLNKFQEMFKEAEVLEREAK